MDLENINNHSLTSLCYRIKSLKKSYVQPNLNKVLGNLEMYKHYENNIHNLSEVIANIIIKLSFQHSNKQSFLNVIQTYNTENKTNLKFNNFKDKRFVHEVLGNIFTSQQPSSTHTLEIKHYFNCLKIFNNSISYKKYGVISFDEIKQIIDKFGKNSLELKFLIDKQILYEIKNTSDEEYYINHNCEYVRIFSKQILTYLLMHYNRGEHGKKDLVTQVVRSRLVNVLGESFVLLSEESREIQDTIYEIIKEEASLNKLNDASKFFNFNTLSLSAYSLILSSIYATDHKRSEFHNLPHWEIYEDLLKLFIYTNKFQNNNTYLIELFKDTSKPDIILKLYNILIIDFPEIAPYLLGDLYTQPIAFEIIDSLKIDSLAINSQNTSTNIEKLTAEFQIKNDLWLEMFNIVLDGLDQSLLTNNSNQCNVSLILINLIDKIFKKIPSPLYQDLFGSSIEYRILLNRYTSALKLLKTKKFYCDIHSSEYNKTLRIIYSILPMLIEEACNFLGTDSGNHSHINISCASVYHSTEVLKIINSIPNDYSEIDKINETKKILISKLYEKFKDFFCVNLTTQKTTYGYEENSFELIDWGLIYLEFFYSKKMSSLDEKITSSLRFDEYSEDDEYSEKDRNQYTKIIIYLKILMTAYISIKKNANKYNHLQNFDQLILNLENLIKQHSTTYSVNSKSEHRIDIFECKYWFINEAIYKQSLIKLLCQCINFFEKLEAENFVKKIFKNSINIGNMLEAKNMVTDEDLRKIISEKINTFNINDYIKLARPLAEIVQSLINLINLKPPQEKLVTLLRQTIETSYRNSEDKALYLFQVDLIIAYKGKNFEELNKINPPKVQRKLTSDILEVKDLYLALSYLDNSKNYDEAINKLTILSSNNPDNLEYAFQLYRAKTLKSTKDVDNVDNTLLICAYNDFYQFWDKISKTQLTHKRIETFSKEVISYTGLFYEISKKNYLSVIQILDGLSNEFKYDFHLIPHVYKLYDTMNKPGLAFNYLTKAKAFIKSLGIEFPDNIDKLFKEKQKDPALIETIKNGMMNFRDINAEYVPKVIPDSLNKKEDLGEFILEEFTQVATILVEKLHSVKSENKYNDLFVAILKLRFAVWEWSITDQSRMGSSSSGKDSGEVDIVIYAGGITLAIAEAFIFRDKNNSCNHIKKLFDYNGSVTKYYVIIYYTSNFEASWEKYKKHFDSIRNKIGMSDLNDVPHQYQNSAIKLAEARNISSKKVQLFHIMINLEGSKICN